MTGGMNRGAKTACGSSGAPTGKANLAVIPEFQRRSLGLIDPATVEVPVNRAQRRAQRKANR